MQLYVSVVYILFLIDNVNPFWNGKCSLKFVLQVVIYSENKKALGKSFWTRNSYFMWLIFRLLAGNFISEALKLSRITLVSCVTLENFKLSKIINFENYNSQTFIPYLRSYIHNIGLISCHAMYIIDTDIYLRKDMDKQLCLKWLRLAHI